MKTLTAIAKLAAGEPLGSAMAMATVVNVRGSAYRRPGARMLIASNGIAAGTISGGCLENDVREQARTVMATGEPRVVTYDSTSPEDIVFGLGLGCNGIVEILVERLTVGDDAGLLAFLGACVARRQAGRVATVFRSDDFPCGTRLMRWPDGRVTGNVRDRAFIHALTGAFQEMSSRRTVIRPIGLPDGREAWVLLETIAPPVPLVVFGAGDDAIPLVNLAKLVGWHVTVIDARPAYATAARFPTADSVLCLHPVALETSTEVVFPAETICMIMTHSFARDLELLRFLLPRQLRYIGILGPKDRTRRLLRELDASDPPPPCVHGPAGLDIGAETPEEIAVSILAEMQAELSRRAGGPLRERKEPIHDPVDQPLACS